MNLENVRRIIGRGIIQNYVTDDNEETSTERIIQKEEREELNEVKESIIKED